jgi:serine/threonine-protein kinase
VGEDAVQPTVPAASGETESPGPALAPGTVLGDRYQIESVLGVGGMGVVYRVVHVHMRKALALKVLHAELSQSPEIKARFEREAVAVGSIEHPNVAAATDFGQLPDGSFFLVCELVVGRSLREEIGAGPLAPARAKSVLRGMTSALVAAHKKSIVHRDLKPENVMLVDRDGDPDFVKVIDFGIAKLDRLADDEAKLAQPLTRIGVVMGTPDYMAPEQALGQPVDARADLYSLGVIYFEMLTGRCPFQGDTLSVLRQHIIDPPPPLPSEVAAQVDGRVQSVVSTLLAKDPKDRYQSADDLLAALDAPAEAAERPVVALAPPRRAVWLFALGATVFLGVSALVWLLVSGRADPPPSPSFPASASASAAPPPAEPSASPSSAPASPPAASASGQPVNADGGVAPGKGGRKHRTLPGGIYIPPPKTWFR